MMFVLLLRINRNIVECKETTSSINIAYILY